MNLRNTIESLGKLGELLSSLPPDQLLILSQRASNENNWFTHDNVRRAIIGATNYLDTSKLNEWSSRYTPVKSPKRIGLVLAGNIPLVGLHDIIAVLVSGHIAVVKTSSRDTVLLNFLLEQLKFISPQVAERINLVDQLRDIDAIIATGSDNTARYFHSYFGKYPNIIRKNRSSLAILNGNEGTPDLKSLGEDIFSYYGLGCRNVSKLLVPKGYKFDSLYESLAVFHSVMDHNKYHNNYDYNKSILLVNSEPHYDNGFLLIHQSESFVSPISVLFYEEYENEIQLDSLISTHQNKIQCVVSNGGWYPQSLAMGQTQLPELWDYADQVDTMAFLCNL